MSRESQALVEAICKQPRQVTPISHADVLRAAFNNICDVNDWKAPIHALIPISKVHLYGDAVEFMTASTPEYRITDLRTNDGEQLIRLTSAGYRAGPCGDQ